MDIYAHIYMYTITNLIIEFAYCEQIRICDRIIKYKQISIEIYL